MSNFELTDELRMKLIDHAEEIRKFLPTTHQSNIIKFVMARKCVESKDVSEHFGMSLPSSSAQLAKLWKMGHITREDVGSPSGGSLYQYGSFYGNKIFKGHDS